MIIRSLIIRAAFCTFAFTSFLANGQTLTSQTGAQSQPGACNRITLLTAPELTFKQRACFYGEDLIAPSRLLSAGFIAAFGQVQNSPHVARQHWDEFPHRLEVYYVSHAAKNSGELIAGYLHHEDPRFRQSTAKGFWRRTSAAFMSVVTSPDEDGRLRMAYAPIAGSLSSAAIDGAMFRHNDSLSHVLTHSGMIYSHYFLRALYMEFRPEIASYTRHLLHRDN